jgi:predicted homoserine dehydrogenase-like protein
MFGLLDQLRKVKSPIKIGIVGIGSIGRGMVLQSSLTPGIECSAIADINLNRAIEVAKQFNYNYKVVSTLSEMNESIQNGQLAVCEDGNLIASCEQISVFIESTSSIVGGALFGDRALDHNQHLIMMNYEADLMYGSYLMSKAKRNSLVYTVCDGDQPAVIKRIMEEVEFMGFKTVMAGNMKGFLDRYVNPYSIREEAAKRDLDPKMCASYSDGSKLCVEMAVMANGIGGYTATPGMYGPKMQDIHEIFNHFDFNQIWDGKNPIVDYVLGTKPRGGVFVIGYTDHPYQKSTLSWLPPDMGPGPFYLFYRPYHLCHFEFAATVAEVVINKRAVLKPDYGFRTNVYAYAKKDLNKGETLDGLGGFGCYGLIENCTGDKIKAGLPICLAENVKLKRDIPRDGKIYLEDIEYDENSDGFALFSKSVKAQGGF